MNSTESLPTPEELRLWSAAFERASTLDVLRWSVAVYGDGLSLGIGFGMSGLVLLDMLVKVHPHPDVFYIDTGLLFPETYDLHRALEKHYGIHLRSVKPALSVFAQEVHYGPRLWEREPDQCCALRKVAPLAQALAGRTAWMTGVRRDQTATRRYTPIFSWDEGQGLAKLSPLAAWSEQACADYVRRQGIPYNPLQDRGYPSLGCWPCTRPVAPGEHPRAGRWAGLGKTECGLHVVNGKLMQVQHQSATQNAQ